MVCRGVLRHGTQTASLFRRRGATAQLSAQRGQMTGPTSVERERERDGIVPGYLGIFRMGSEGSTLSLHTRTHTHTHTHTHTQMLSLIPLPAYSLHSSSPLTFLPLSSCRCLSSLSLLISFLLRVSLRKRR